MDASTHPWAPLAPAGTGVSMFAGAAGGDFAGVRDQSAGLSPDTVPAPAHRLAAALAGVVDEVVAAVAATTRGVGGLSGPGAGEVLLAMFTQVSRLTVAGARLSVSVDDDGLWAVDGARSFTHWLAAATGMRYHRARDLVATGRALRDHLPATAAAALAGEVSADQTATIATLAPTTEARREALAAPFEECGEGFLVEQAKALPADSFRNLVRRWAAAADPEADERGYREACEREFVALAPTVGGCHLSGFLTTEHGALFDTALRSAMTPPEPSDTRTTQQRRAQAVADLSRLVLDHGLAGTGAAVRPHLTVVVDYDTLRRAVGSTDDRDTWAGEGAVADAGAAADDDTRADEGAVANANPDRAGNLTDRPAAPPSRSGGVSFTRPDDHAGCLFHLRPVADVERFAVAEILGAGPIPQSVLARLACDGELNRVIFGPDSQVINAGRAERTYSGPRRKAIIARDGTCRYPGCTAPPALGEIHHIDQWARDHGDTDINRGILLCWYHHDLVHNLHIEIRRSPTGGWTFHTHHGDPVTRAV